MLKKVNRLPADISFRNASSIYSTHFILKVAVNDTIYSRFGFIISKRTAINAVDRNRSKRLLRSCVESLISKLPKGFDFLFILKKNLNDKSKPDLEQEVEKALNKWLQ